MTTITVTPDLIERLGNLSEKIEFRDPQGRLVGEYYPASLSGKFVNPIDGSPRTEEELRKLSELDLQELQGRPLKEILRDLESRT